MNHLKKIFTWYFFHFPVICSFVLHLWLPNALTLASRPNLGFNMGLGHFGHPVAPLWSLWCRRRKPQRSSCIITSTLRLPHLGFWWSCVLFCSSCRIKFYLVRLDYRLCNPRRRRRLSKFAAASVRIIWARNPSLFLPGQFPGWPSQHWLGATALCLTFWTCKGLRYIFTSKYYSHHYCPRLKINPMWCNRFFGRPQIKKGKGPPTPPQLGIRKVFLDVLNTGLGISLHLGLVEYTRLA